MGRLKTKKLLIAMFSISVLTILALNLFPEQQTYKAAIYNERVQEVLEIPKNSMLQLDTVVMPVEKLGRTPATTNAPIQPQIIIQMPVEQDFDWKGSISWIIAAVNGLVLLVLNLKKFKK